MTRKDFQLIADVLRRARIADPALVDTLAVMFADALATTNPGFNRERFLKAVRGA